ncbi:MAG: FecR family protein [Bacteroidota bacterium]|jgi:ferric-dicitrate binding protein FerR (iron transport regulator)
MELHNNIQEISMETNYLFSGAKIEWSSTKEFIFSSKFESILDQTEVKTISLRQIIVKLSLAASVIILLGLATFAMMYTKTVYSPAGTHLSMLLPDNSSAELNAETSLSYYPYRWFFQRTVQLEGEAFFSVQKGKKFTVKSEMGETSVLGTSFNILARNQTYRVICMTGKVIVISNQDESVILHPNQIAILESGNILKEENLEAAEHMISWRKNMFLFNSVPFSEVLREIERQYGISIATEENLGGQLSVSFQKNMDVEKTLSMVCKPLGYRFIKKTENNYLISGK